MRISRMEDMPSEQPQMPRTGKPIRRAAPQAQTWEDDEGPEFLAQRPPLSETGEMLELGRARQAAEYLYGEEYDARPRRKKDRKNEKKKRRPEPEYYDDYEDDDEEDDRRPRWHAPVGCLLLLAIMSLVFLGANKVLDLYAEVCGSSELGEELIFVVQQGANATQIAKELQAAGFVEHDWLFRYYAQYSGKGESLQFGGHTLRKGMSYNDILRSLSQQVERRQTITLTFPEGSTSVAIAQILQDNGLCSIEDFLACANGEDGSDFSQYDFWTMIPDNPGRLLKCEGYLFPNTYEFYVDESVYYYVDVFYREFARQTEDLMDEIAASGSSLDEVVILASFIQEEAGFTSGAEALLNNQRVSACFYNRLHSTDPLWSAHRLESNACSYIMQEVENNYLWNSPMANYMGWRDAGLIPESVLNVYDTYRISGLPAGAISNPGRVCLEAAMSPDQQYIDEGYYFFVTGHPDTAVAGQYFFAKTANEHNANVAKAGW